MTEAPPPPSLPAAPPPELAHAYARFHAGDFAGVRTELAEIVSKNPSAEVIAAARDLAARLDIDPWAFRVGLFALGLLALVAAAYL